MEYSDLVNIPLENLDQAPKRDVEVGERLVNMANDIMSDIYSKVKLNDLSNPVVIIVQVMELVEKVKGLSGEDKKNVVIIVVERLNEKLNIIAPKNLEGIIDTICFVSKTMPKINITPILKKIKKIFTIKCKCLNQSS